MDTGDCALLTSTAQGRGGGTSALQPEGGYTLVFLHVQVTELS